MKKLLFCLLVLICFISFTSADTVYATTDEGRRVALFEDGTYMFIAGDSIDMKGAYYQIDVEQTREKLLEFARNDNTLQGSHKYSILTSALDAKTIYQSYLGKSGLYSMNFISENLVALELKDRIVEVEYYISYDNILMLKSEKDGEYVAYGVLSSGRKRIYMGSEGNLVFVKKENIL